MKSQDIIAFPMIAAVAAAIAFTAAKAPQSAPAEPSPWPVETLDIKQAGAGVVVQWQAYPGTNYELQFSADNATWQSLWAGTVDAYAGPITHVGDGGAGDAVTVAPAPGTKIMSVAAWMPDAAQGYWRLMK